MRMPLTSSEYFHGPRGESWRRGNYSVVRVTEGLRTGQHTLDDRFLSKIAALGEQLSRGEGKFGTVILLGINEHGPLTVLDGNHRLVAALLSSPAGLSKTSIYVRLFAAHDRMLLV